MSMAVSGVSSSAADAREAPAFPADAYASPPRAPTHEQERAVLDGPVTSPLPAATKRRATSLSDLLPLPSVSSKTASAKMAVASAIASVSSRTTQRFAKFRSSSDNFMKNRPPMSAWKLPANLKLRRNRSGGDSKPGSPFRWTERDSLQHGSAWFEYHGEDAGAATGYFHIVADGVSSPFGRNSLANIDHVPVSSEYIATEVVRCVRSALEDVTNHNHFPIDAATFESAVVEAIKTARINCFQFRKSRLATTLSVAYFDRWKGKLLTFTLGDSKCVVVRNGEVVYETLDVLREFNVPCVVNLSNQVTSHEYMVQSFSLQENDVCLTFSDGVGDNLYKDDITRVIATADRFGSASTDKHKDNGASLQEICELLVSMSKLQDREAKPVSAVRSHKVMDAAPTPVFPLGDAEDFVSPKLMLLDNCMANDNTNSASLYPFATAAAVEYRARALEECRGGAATDQQHLSASLSLYERHKVKQTLDRHVIVRKASRKRHYSLLQLKRMAEMQTKKPDDITLFMTRFVRQHSED